MSPLLAWAAEHASHAQIWRQVYSEPHTSGLKRACSARQHRGLKLSSHSGGKALLGLVFLDIPQATLLHLPKPWLSTTTLSGSA